MEKLIITGYVGRDAEIKEFNGTKYTSFSLAVDKSYKKQDGSKVDRTNWYNILKQGEGLARHIKKGTFLTIMGNPSTKLYRDQNGNTKISLNLNADDVSFGPGNKQEAAAPQVSNTANYHASMSSNGSGYPEPSQKTEEDDLPF
jgi:single-strand DNA-binding protein